ncbi:MAG TPA: insulinase family protein [Gemmatimonadaceae bacterium]|nr:insulinase family protein [Gemmatimonadaceae bacterium]
MPRFVRSSLAALAFLVPDVADAQGPALASPLQLDAAVTVGKLPNGLTYYIRQNARPARRAELRLVVNVGSVLEDDTQRGYAHFVEHMAFNGTRRFSANDLAGFMNSIGASLGADVNASTSADETIYTLRIPSDQPLVIDAALQLLSDFAGGQLFDPQEVIAERGVVLEEWRQGLGADQRMRDKALPILLKDSRYAQRSPIGTDTSIKTAEAAGLRKFYDTWYRPELMAVIVVGDFDPKRVEGMIKDQFNGLRGRADAVQRPVVTVPDNAEPLVAILKDREVTNSFINVSFKQKARVSKTIGDYRRGLIEDIYIGMLNDRLVEPTRQPNAPYRGAGMSLGSFMGRETDAFTLSASVNDGGMEFALESMLLQVRRADEFGFLQTELDRAKSNITRSYERAFAERESRTSASFVGAYISHFLYGFTPLSLEYRQQLVKDVLPTITLAEVNGLATKWITTENRVIQGAAPEIGFSVPTEQQIQAVFAKAARATVTAYAEASLDGPLLSSPPQPGRVTAERVIASMGVTEWQLSNGARVLVKPTTYKNDEVLFSGSSIGGLSLLLDKDYHNANLAGPIVGTSGAGRFNSTDLTKKLAGKAATSTFSIGPTSESVGGTASPKDLETLLQLTHLRVTEPRVDTAAWTAAKERAVQTLANREKDPATAFNDTLEAVMNGYHPRAVPPSLAALDSVDLGRALEIFKDRFADFSDFTFSFVGNVKPETLKPLVETYLASLPSTNRKETWKPWGNPPLTGVHEKVIQKGTEPRAVTLFAFTGPFKPSADEVLMLDALSTILNIRLINTLREQLGVVYSGGASSEWSRIPREEYTISIGFPSSPGNAARIARAVLAAVDSLQTRGPTNGEVTLLRDIYKRSREASVRSNSYWMAALSSLDEISTDSVAVRVTTQGDERLKKVTADRVRDAAKLYLNLKNYIKFTWFPEITGTN